MKTDTSLDNCLMESPIRMGIDAGSDRRRSD
jgi:hypothetical protein